MSNPINGIDVDALTDTMEQVNVTPHIAKFTFCGHNTWKGGARCSTSIKEFAGAGEDKVFHKEEFVLEADEPAVLLGDDSAPNATEALLHALASCLNASFIYHAAMRRIPIDALEFTLEGTLDAQGFLGLSNEVRNGFDEIRIVCRVQSDAPKEKLEELCHLAQQRSPVFDMVTNPVPVTVALQMD